MRPILIDPTKGSVGRTKSAAVFGLSASWTGGTADLLSFGSGASHQHRPIGARQAENLAFLATLGWRGHPAALEPTRVKRSVDHRSAPRARQASETSRSKAHGSIELGRAETL